MHVFSSITCQNLYNVIWTVRTPRKTLRTRFSYHVEEHLSLQSRVLEVVVLPLDFSISALLGKVQNGMLHSLASWDASGYHKCDVQKFWRIQQCGFTKIFSCHHWIHALKSRYSDIIKRWHNFFPKLN